MSFCTPTCRRWTVFGFASFFIVVGILIVCLWNSLVQSIKHQQLNVASKDTTEYKLWEETPIPMYIEFYLFHWNNSDEVLGSKWTQPPSFIEKGPYTFSEKHIRKQVKFNENNGTVTYKTQRIWHFMADMSKGSLDDQVTTLNPILVTVANIVKYRHTIVKMGVNFFLEEKQVKVTVTKKVREFIFDGYDDPMLELLKKLHLKNIDIPFTKFGWFAERNNSVDYDGVFNMFDGSNDLDKLGRMYSWNFKNRTSFYPNHCGQVNGTSGELWYPIGDDQTVQVFASDVCSTVTLYHDGEDSRFGISGHKYIGTEKLFDNGTKYGDMACFSPGEVLRSGVRNMSECKFNAPAFVSFPHFYLADPYYREAIKGMNPDKSKHEFFVSIEPETGLPLQAHAALQLNIRIEPIDHITLLKNVKEHFMPALWFKQYARLSEDLANKARILVILPAIGEYTGYSVIGIGSLLFLLFGFLVLKNQWKGTEEEHLLSQETN